MFYMQCLYINPQKGLSLSGHRDIKANLMKTSLIWKALIRGNKTFLWRLQEIYIVEDYTGLWGALVVIAANQSPYTPPSRPKIALALFN